ncbi:SDR family oxidoreductase [Halanaerobacter jeridensis]|uniref:dTDP-4-dehydrorhamnose reductase n=1 Tax=Halanaerobacter jeridensis TaxID=706427 RepID=A0A938XQC1_9FIRM|nr:SDR family oxidoreductase [Halanaerobacter jeridensis]MBM7557457.1 dTDP-4-dehydrorhamnose reductase [Halanaerobacter jeridensis]
MQSNKKVLITGISGMLGKDIARIIKKNFDYEIYGIARDKPNYLEGLKLISLDLTNFQDLETVLANINPDLIINSAANVNIKECENNKKAAFKINADVPKILASYQPSKTKLVHISTDSIFDGDKGNYDEAARENPLNNYAKSKLAGEKKILQQNKNAIIARTNIVGFHIPWGSSLVEWGLDSLKNQETIYGFTDTYFNPVYTKQLARIIMKLVENTNYKGRINIASDQFISKYEFLVKLAQLFDYNSDLIEPSSIERLYTNLKRPKNTTLNIDKLKQTLDVEEDINLDLGLKELRDDLKNYRKED